MRTPEHLAAHAVAARFITGGELTWDKYWNRLIDRERPSSAVGLACAIVGGLLMAEMAPDQMQRNFRQLLLDGFKGEGKKIIRMADEHWSKLLAEYAVELARYRPADAAATAVQGADPT